MFFSTNNDNNAVPPYRRTSREQQTFNHNYPQNPLKTSQDVANQSSTSTIPLCQSHNQQVSNQPQPQRHLERITSFNESYSQINHHSISFTQGLHHSNLTQPVSSTYQIQHIIKETDHQPKKISYPPIVPVPTTTSSIQSKPFYNDQSSSIGSHNHTHHHQQYQSYQYTNDNSISPVLHNHQFLNSQSLDLYYIRNLEKLIKESSTQLERNYHNKANSKEFQKIKSLLKKKQWKSAENALLQFIPYFNAGKRFSSSKNWKPLLSIFGKNNQMRYGDYQQKKGYYDVDNIVELMIVQNVLNEKYRNCEISVDYEEMIARVNGQYHIQAYYHLLYVLMEQKKYEKVIDTVERMMKYNPVSVFSRFERIECFKVLRKLNHLFIETLLCFDVSYLPKHIAKCYRNFGFYFIEYECWEKALACFMKSMKYEVNTSVLHELRHIEQVCIPNYVKKRTESWLKNDINPNGTQLMIKMLQNKYCNVIEQIQEFRKQIVNYLVEHRVVDVPVELMEVLPNQLLPFIYGDENFDDNFEAQASFNISIDTENNNNNNMDIDSNFVGFKKIVGYRSYGYEYNSAEARKKRSKYRNILSFEPNEEEWINNWLSKCEEEINGMIYSVPLHASTKIVNNYKTLIQIQSNHQDNILNSLRQDPYDSMEIDHNSMSDKDNNKQKQKMNFIWNERSTYTQKDLGHILYCLTEGNSATLE